jgi:hypothetical protein
MWLGKIWHWEHNPVTGGYSERIDIEYESIGYWTTRGIEDLSLLVLELSTIVDEMWTSGKFIFKFIESDLLKSSGIVVGWGIGITGVAVEFRIGVGVGVGIGDVVWCSFIVEISLKRRFTSSCMPDLRVWRVSWTIVG